MKIPCEDCITLSICKAEVMGEDGFRFLVPLSIVTKCTLVRNYCETNGDILAMDGKMWVEKSMEVMKFLKDA